jgi:hypothetical protein
MRRNHAFILSLVTLFFALLPWTAAAQEPAEVSIQPPAAVPGAGETFTTDVTVANAAGLLGFQFDVNFDPTMLAVETIALGPFLASTGRSPQPLGPDATNATSGRVVFGGFTLGTPDQPGASGDGVVATITWKVVQPAEFQATLSRVQLAGAGGRALPGSDTPAPPTQSTESQPAVKAAPAQPSPTTAPTATPAAEPGNGDGLPVAVIAALVVVAIAVVALLVVRRSKANTS